MKTTVPAALVIGTMLALPLAAADEAALRKDLAAVIALQGQPCGEVVRVEVKGQSDYVATCKDGNRYRVYTSPEGRVIVKKQ